MQGPHPRHGARKKPFVPRVEPLEGRSLPALLAPVSPAPGVVEFVASGNGNNTLNVFDDGLGHLSFNTTTVAGKRTALPASFGPAIHEVIYAAGPGSDTFTYNMLAGASLREAMTVLVVLPPTGNKGFTGTFGTFTRPPVPGSPGTPPTAAVPGAPVNVDGRLAVEILGSPLKDNVTLKYAGVVKGDLRTSYVDGRLSGNLPARLRDGDKVSFTLDLLAHSSGTVRPKIRGGVGDDALTLFVFQHRKQDRVRIFGRGALDGGAGLNSGVSFYPPITEVNIQS